MLNSTGFFFSYSDEDGSCWDWGDIYKGNTKLKSQIVRDKYSITLEKAKTTIIDGKIQLPNDREASIEPATGFDDEIGGWVLISKNEVSFILPNNFVFMLKIGLRS